VIVLEGSGASLPPVAADRTVCITRGESEAFAGLGPLRLMRADLVVLLGVRPPELSEWSRAPVVSCRLEPEPAEPIESGRRVAVFTTAGPESSYAIRGALARFGFEVVLLSTNLARRAALEGDLDMAVRERSDVFLTELKAAAIDTVAERAEREGLRTVLMRNEVVPMPGELDLDDELWRLYEDVVAGVGR
jgi:cyclic 2,3-diphosphoglycerate synthase